MKMILKVFALPVLLIMKSVCILGNLLSNISSHVIGLLLLILVGCGINSVVKAMWTSLANLAVMGLAAFLALFGIVFLTVQAETASESLGQFLRS